MKKRISILIFLIMILIPFQAFALENSKEAIFKGDIKQVRQFYPGEYTNSYDYKITGIVYDKESNEQIPLKDWKLLSIEPVKDDEAKITLKYLPDMDKDIPQYHDIEITIPITTKPYNDSLKRQVFSKILTFETDIHKIFNPIDFVFRNSNGKAINGTLKYEDVKLHEGVNLVMYSFYPEEVLNTGYGYEEYTVNTGTIKIIVD
jgi:hypothetical protein